MKYTVVLILIFSTACIKSVRSQTIVKDGKYLFIDDKKADKEAVNKLLMQKESSAAMLVKSQASRSSAQTGGILTGTALVGTIIVYSSVDQNRGGFIPARVVYLGLGLGVTSLLGLITLLNAEEANSRYKSALDLYNNDVTVKKESSTLELGLTGNGIGLVYSF